MTLCKSAALLSNLICSVSDEMFIKRFRKLLEAFLWTLWITFSPADHGASNISSSLKMIKFIHLWKALL